MLRILRDWLRRLVISVPSDMAACEFDCHKTECHYGDWRNCPRRLELQREQDEPPADD